MLNPDVTYPSPTLFSTGVHSSEKPKISKRSEPNLRQLCTASPFALAAQEHQRPKLSKFNLLTLKARKRSILITDLKGPHSEQALCSS